MISMLVYPFVRTLTETPAVTHIKKKKQFACIFLVMTMVGYLIFAGSEFIA